MKLLYGDQLIKKQEECELKGFMDVNREVIKKVMDNKAEEIYRCEVQFLLSKMS